MIVTLLTDYGLDDEFAGVCHGVIRRTAPDVAIVDITHGITQYDVREGAVTLRNALHYMPSGVHVAIVDPQVGTERRAVAVRCANEERVLVGPDNGLLSLAWHAFGGAVEAVDISRSQHRLEPLSATFHGRDLFAPVAAALAAGAPFADAGDPLDPAELEELSLPQARRDGDALVTHALIVDGYGNVALGVGHADALEAGLRLGGHVDVNGREAQMVQTFADLPAGELLIYEDAWRSLALAVNRGSAAGLLGLRQDDEVRLAPR